MTMSTRATDCEAVADTAHGLTPEKRNAPEMMPIINSLTPRIANPIMRNDARAFLSQLSSTCASQNTNRTQAVIIGIALEVIYFLIKRITHQFHQGIIVILAPQVSSKQIYFFKLSNTRFNIIYKENYIKWRRCEEIFNKFSHESSHKRRVLAVVGRNYITAAVMLRLRRHHCHGNGAAVARRRNGRFLG